MRRAVALCVLVACSRDDEPEGNPRLTPASSSDRIDGKLSVEGAPAILRECHPGHAVHTFLEVVTSKGKLRFEGSRLYWSREPDSIMRGEPLECSQLDRSWGGGNRPDGTAYWRGTLAFRCTGPAAIEGDLKLDCGNITAVERAQLDGNRKDLLEQQRDGGP